MNWLVNSRRGIGKYLGLWALFVTSMNTLVSGALELGRACFDRRQNPDRRLSRLSWLDMNDVYQSRGT